MLRKPKMILYIILLAVAIGLMVMLKQCGKSISGNNIAAPSDTISVGLEYSPLTYYMYDDTLGGFNYDMLRLLSKKANIHFRYIPVVTLQKSLDDLESGKYQILVAQLPMTKENKEHYLFSEPIYLDRQVLVQRKDSLGHIKIKNQLDLAGDTVYVVAGSPMESRISSLSREIGDTIYVKKDNLYGPEQLFLMVKEGIIDYAVINEGIAGELVKKYPQISIHTNVSFTQFQSWILSKSETKLCDSINVWINRLKSTPEYRNLYSRYFKDATH